MPFKKRNSKKEKKILDDLVKTNNSARAASIEYDAIYNFRSLLIKARKNNDISQVELSKITGLSQQSISRIETGAYNTTLESLFKYLNGIGYSLTIKKINKWFI